MNSHGALKWWVDNVHIFEMCPYIFSCTCAEWVDVHNTLATDLLNVQHSMYGEHKYVGYTNKSKMHRIIKLNYSTCIGIYRHTIVYTKRESLHHEFV